jgi:hypothetical protein
MTFSPHSFNCELILNSATSGVSNHNELLEGKLSYDARISPLNYSTRSRDFLLKSIFFFKKKKKSSCR